MNGNLVRDLDLEQLDKLHDAYKMVLHTVREANNLFAEGKAKSLQQTADDVAMELGSRNIPTKKAALIAQKAANKLGWNFEKLYYALDRIGSKTFAELINRVADSEDTVMRDAKEAHDFLLETVKKYGYNNWKVNREIDRVFKDSIGREFKLTLGQMMALYAYSRRKGAWDHIQYGGFVFGKAALTNPRPADSYKLTREQCEAITNLLTPEQKAYVEEMQKYLSEVMGAKGNEVSMALYGIEMFKEKNYFPIHVAGQFQAKAQESQAKQAAGFGSMSNAGFTQAQNPNAKAPFVLEAFNEIWADHVNEMARYHGAVPALEDLRRVMNRSAYSSNTESSTSIKQIMENHYGKEAVEYFDNLYREANSGAVYEKLQKTSKKLLGLFRKNSVAYSLSVLVQQSASIVRAYAMVDRKYFGFKGVGAISSSAAKAIFRKEEWEKTYAEMLKYAPGVTLAKEIGGFDTASGGSIRQYLLDTGKSFRQQMNTGTGKEKAGAVMNLVDDNKVANLPNVADKIAWMEIWNACKRETVHNNPKLSTGSEEFLEKVGQRFTEVILATQVYDSIFAKSPMLKSKNLAVQMLVSFMNEPNTTANMVESALRDFGRKQGKLGARKLQVVLHSILFTGVMKSIIYAMRDDDEDETFVEKYMESLAGSILDDVNPANYIPIARDIWSLAQGYDVERADMSIVSDAVDALNSVVNNAQTDTEDMTEAQLVAFDKKCTKANWRLAESIAAFLGIPLKNVRREINAVLNHAQISHDNAGKGTWKSTWDKIQDAVLDSIPFADTPDKTERLYRAVTSGDAQYRKRFEDTYESESDLNSALRKALRAHDPRVREAAEALNSGDNAKYRKLLKEITGEGHFSGENIEAAIQAEAEKLAVLAFEREHPDVEGITYAAVKAYKEASNVPAEVFYEAWQYKSGRKKEEVLGYIDGLELTRKQKDALYLAFGWAESKLDEAPWN
jgi:Spy/CpxP family protein refolding chaperone/predicted component of type VI protein secretion system